MPSYFLEVIMPIVKKLNKIYTIPHESVDSFLKDGFNEIDEKGKIIKRATGGFEVSCAIYNKALDKIEALEKELAELKKVNKSKEK